MFGWVITLLVVVISAFAGRAHGIGQNDPSGKPTGWPKWGRIASVVWFAGLSFVGSMYVFHIWQIAIAGAYLTGWALSTGHGRFFAMQGANLADPNPEWIERNVASWAYHGDITKPRYSWFCMGVKGLLFGLSVFPIGLILAYLWPAAYADSFALTNDSKRAEYMTGSYAGLVFMLTIFIFGA